MGNLIFNGISTIDMGVQIQTPPVYEFPIKEYESLHLEGRIGDLVINKNSFRNVKRTYYLALGFTPNSTFVSNARMLVEWLLSVDGYARLEDSYESDYYRMALFEDPGEIPNIYDRATAFEISFNCKPQRYLKSGDIPFIITQRNVYMKIINPTKCIALPEITLAGNGLTVQFFAGEDYATPKYTSSLVSTYNSEFRIDSEMQDCYTNTEYVNNNITLTNGFPKLYPGTNWIRITGNSLSKFEMKPRWWTL